jgi:hypothetical protein
MNKKDIRILNIQITNKDKDKDIRINNKDVKENKENKE